MKKILSVLLILALLAVLPVFSLATNSSAALTGPETVRAGDTITLTFTLSGVGILGASGTLEYDPDQLQFIGTKQLIAAPWMVEWNGNNMVAYDNKLESPINSGKSLFSVIFKVRDLPEGTDITVSCKDVTTSDGDADTYLGTISYTAKVAAPLATDNLLKELKVTGGKLQPSFDPAITSYTSQVPYEVAQLHIEALAAHEKAQVTINSPQLTPNGVTDVTITVVAENGAKRVYTITVTREQDPNYQASGNNALQDITVEGFLLSPVFAPDVTEYVVWLPYEVSSVQITGSPADSRATAWTEGGEALLPGQDNLVQVICRAENGQEKIYTIVVKRAAAHGTEPVIPTEPKPTEPQPTDPKPTGTTAPTTRPAAPTTQPTMPQQTTGTSGGSPWWVALIVGLVCLLGGAAGGFLLSDQIKALLPGKRK